LLPAVRATTRKRSGNSSASSRVWVPIEPVEPSTERAFTGWLLDGGAPSVPLVWRRPRSGVAQRRAWQLALLRQDAQQ